MRKFSSRRAASLILGASTLALAAPGIAWAQDDSAPVAADGQGEASQEIVVTGIRASLRESMNIKRDAQGVVDAISAEDIGKFPDTNLAESLQRITGVSIDRSNGEGSTVTVRGFGPEFNLVLLNGRQMPTSSLGDGASPPSSRSFDFANLASEGVAAVEVYKSGRASVPSGGIGSTINIKTPRPFDNPGLHGSVAVKGAWDTSQNDGADLTPEVSGIISDTFANDAIGIMVNGIYQKRKASNNQASVGWLDGYLGSNPAGQLPQPGGTGYENITNPPGANDVYAVPQSASYNLNDINRERINAQAALQIRPIDSLVATIDYTYSQNTVEVRNNSVGIWFNNGNDSSEWGDGPVAAPIVYSEAFGATQGKDLSYSGSLTANRTINRSIGGNLKWEAPGGVTVELDAHHSTAESKPTNKYGSSTSIGTAVFGVANQSIDFTQDLPIISVAMNPGIDALDASLITPTGNSFRNAYFRDEINQVQLSGHYDHDGGVLDALDFGFTYTENDVRSAYGYIQNDTWGGAGPASDIPDDIFELATLPDKFKGVGGAGDPAMIQQFYRFDFERLADQLNDLYGICSNPATGSAQANTCLANYTVDRRIKEKTIAPFVQARGHFYAMGAEAHVIAGLRYEQTIVDSKALVPIPTGTAWVSAGEFNIRYSNESDFTQFKGSYDNWLPAIDFDIEPIRNVKLRASYSHTITRADYASLQGGRTIDSLFRITNGTGSQGNPGLEPYKSKNIDLSAEWYYGPSSYISVGYFNKNVSNFISSTRVDTSAFGLTNPASGPRYNAAVAALGADATPEAIRNYIFANYPDSVIVTGTDSNGNTTGQILGLPEDDPVTFQITTPVNSDQTANLHGWEFAVQHSFWNTGFGVIANYTIVNGDATYDNTLPATATQFALVGLSNSANVVGFFDKYNIQARVAYNWRDKFLSGSGPNPFYVEAYGQVDASASYEFMHGLTVFVEGINLTGESRRGHRRSDNTVTFAAPGYARYTAGVRFNF
ncbi:TonB-dependent receptor [Sphingomonas sp. RS6]